MANLLKFLSGSPLILGRTPCRLSPSQNRRGSPPHRNVLRAYATKMKRSQRKRQNLRLEKRRPWLAASIRPLVKAQVLSEHDTILIKFISSAPSQREKLMRCGTCKVGSYSSNVPQRNDWTGHMPYCVGIVHQWVQCLDAAMLVYSRFYDPLLGSSLTEKREIYSYKTENCQYSFY